MKNAANIAILAITALTIEAYTSTTALANTTGILWHQKVSAISGTKDTTGDEAQQFIHMAAISGMTEVQLSQLAIKKAQSSAVKKFAYMMVKDHTGANAELKALASAKKITLPDSSSLTDAASSANVSSAGSAGTTGTSASTTDSNTGDTNNSGGGKNMSPAEKMDRLNTASSKEFDQNYMQLMIADHVKAVSLFTKGSKSSDPQVAAYASKYLPALKMHLQHATAVAKTTVGQTTAQ